MIYFSFIEIFHTVVCKSPMTWKTPIPIFWRFCVLSVAFVQNCSNFWIQFTNHIFFDKLSIFVIEEVLDHTCAKESYACCHKIWNTAKPPYNGQLGTNLQCPLFGGVRCLEVSYCFPYFEAQCMFCSVKHFSRFRFSYNVFRIIPDPFYISLERYLF